MNTRKHRHPGLSFAIITLLCLFLLPVNAQEADTALRQLPFGFEDLKLGLAIDEIKDILKKSDSFYYRGDPDVSLLERENRTLLEVEGLNYFADAQFQFSPDDRLFVIVLVMDPDRIDYFSLYSTLIQKYGDPDDLSPQRAFWTDERMQLSLERPVTLRYIYTEVFDALAQEGEALKSYERISREDFLSRF